MWGGRRPDARWALRNPTNGSADGECPFAGLNGMTNVPTVLTRVERIMWDGRDSSVKKWGNRVAPGLKERSLSDRSEAKSQNKT